MRFSKITWLYSPEPVIAQYGPTLWAYHAPLGHRLEIGRYARHSERQAIAPVKRRSGKVSEAARKHLDVSSSLVRIGRFRPNMVGMAEIPGYRKLNLAGPPWRPRLRYQHFPGICTRCQARRGLNRRLIAIGYSASRKMWAASAPAEGRAQPILGQGICFEAPECCGYLKGIIRGD
jgi:hypothetical protein